jgi:hypothetical protein
VNKKKQKDHISSSRRTCIFVLSNNVFTEHFGFGNKRKIRGRYNFRLKSSRCSQYNKNSLLFQHYLSHQFSALAVVIRICSRGWNICQKKEEEKTEGCTVSLFLYILVVCIRCRLLFIKLRQRILYSYIAGGETINRRSVQLFLSTPQGSCKLHLVRYHTFSAGCSFASYVYFIDQRADSSQAG